MRCPYCGNNKNTVTGRCNRKSDGDRNELRRYRKCLTCKATFVTVERLINPRIEKELEDEQS